MKSRFLKGGAIGVLLGLPLTSLFSAVSFGLFGSGRIFYDQPFQELNIACSFLSLVALLAAFTLGGLTAITVERVLGRSDSLWRRCVLGAGIGTLTANLGMGLLRFRFHLMTRGFGQEGVDVLRVSTDWVLAAAIASGLLVGALIAALVYRPESKVGKDSAWPIHSFSLVCVELSCLVHCAFWKLTPLYLQLSP